MEGQITLTEWTKWKEDIRQKLKETAENFVYIGYRLKQIRDSGMFNGCEDIFDFAKKEYGLEKSTVSRFIAINEKFSESGNSLELKKEYSSFGSSKLAEMLTLPDAECQLITDRTTVREIRELKQFSRQQEVPSETGETEYTPLQKCIIDYFSDVKRRDDLNEIIRLRLEETPSVKNEELAAYHANPGEYAVHRKGIIYLFLYDFETGVKYKSMMDTEPIGMSWTDFINEIVKIFEPYYSEDWKIWTNFYGIPADDIPGVKVEEPQESQGRSEAVATSQQKEKSGDLEEQDMEENEEAEDDSEEDIRDDFEPEEEEYEEEPADEDNATEESEDRTRENTFEDNQVVNSPLKKLREEAEELADAVKQALWNQEDPDIFPESLKMAKQNAEQLAAVLEQMIYMSEEEEDE